MRTAFHRALTPARPHSDFVVDDSVRVFGAVFAVGTVAGPLIGGVLVDISWLGWRRCFFIGVPLASLAIVRDCSSCP